MLWEWGEAVRTGRLEALVEASLVSLSESGQQRAPGTHSDPTAARVLASEAHDLAVSMTVDREIRHWRKDKHLKLWAAIADLYYASPHRFTNDDVAGKLKITERTVEGCRRQMRRILWMAVIGAEITSGSA